MVPMAEERTQTRLFAGLDPRQRIYRDRFNEYFVFVLSAGGAAVVVPLTLLIVSAFTGQFSVWIFLAASIALELALIFGLGRPQMQPIERAGWSLLWGTSAAVLGLCFYYLVVDNLL
jgi:hypothetical protein